MFPSPVLAQAKGDRIREKVMFGSEYPPPPRFLLIINLHEKSLQVILAIGVTLKYSKEMA